MPAITPSNGCAFWCIVRDSPPAKNAFVSASRLCNLNFMKLFWHVFLLLGLQELLPATVTAAETNHNFARWEKDIAAFERKDETNRPPPHASLFIGSSTIARWQTLAQDFAGRPVINRGFGGSEIVDATHFAPRVVFPCAPRQVFLRAGGNDLWAGKSVAQVFADFQDFARTIHARLPDTEIIYISLSPSVERWSQHAKEKELNSRVADFIAGKPWLKYLETYDIPLGADGNPRPELFVADKLHLNAAGYRLLAEKVRPLLAQ